MKKKATGKRQQLRQREALSASELEQVNGGDYSTYSSFGWYYYGTWTNPGPPVIG